MGYDNASSEVSSAAAAAAESLALRDYTVANNFDPTVSGQASAVGSTMRTADGAKSWVKTGTGNTQWTPLHSVSMSFGTQRNAWNTRELVDSLACDTLGGFILQVSGKLVTTGTNIYMDFNEPVGSPVPVWNQNRQTTVHNGGIADGNALVAKSYDHSALVCYTADGPEPFCIVIEGFSHGVRSSADRCQWVRVTATGAYSNVDRRMMQMSLISRGTAFPQNELTNIGLYGVAFDATCQATLSRW